MNICLNLWICLGNLCASIIAHAFLNSHYSFDLALSDIYLYPVMRKWLGDSLSVARRSTKKPSKLFSNHLQRHYVMKVSRSLLTEMKNASIAKAII